MAPTATAMIIAVAAAALAGFLISRPQGPVSEVPATSPVPTPNAPFSTDGYSVADDVATNQVVVFGGDLSLDQTWVWNGRSWHLEHPRTSPSGREEAAMAYDPRLQMVLLFGGIRPAETGLQDTWGWNGTTWRELDATSGGPPPGEAAMAWDPALNAMVLMPSSSSGADTWTWSGDHWIDHRQTDPYLPTGVLALAFDPGTQALMAVGFGNVVGPGIGAVIQSWKWDGATWRQIVTSHVPTAYGILGLVWDPVTARFVFFGEGPLTNSPTSRWVWTGSDWTQLVSVPAPRIIEGQLTEENTSAVLLVGEVSAAPGAITPIEVWTWTGSAWAAHA